MDMAPFRNVTSSAGWHRREGKSQSKAGTESQDNRP